MTAMTITPTSAKIASHILAIPKAFVRVEAIILSMTPAERAKPSIINPKRKRRIAAGSGTSVEEVNRLLRQFEAMQKLMKQVKKNPRAFGRRMNMGF